MGAGETVKKKREKERVKLCVSNLNDNPQKGSCTSASEACEKTKRKLRSGSYLSHRLQCTATQAVTV